jgi:copper(I)-binding protein
MKQLKIFFSALILVTTNAVYASGVDIENAWVREAPPGMQMLAGYMIIENETGKNLVLTGASSPVFGTIELHQTTIKNGMASMEQQKSVTIPANSKFAFKPKSYHLMLMKPKRDLRKGDKVKITLQFSNYKKVTKTFAVRRSGDNMMHHHHESREEMHEREEEHHDHDMHHHK